jgi:hypothetical protein
VSGDFQHLEKRNFSLIKMKLANFTVVHVEQREKTIGTK